MFFFKMQKGHSLQGFYDGSMFFGATFLEDRHNLIGKELFGHKTPIKIPQNLIEEYPLILPTDEDYEESLSVLLDRCKECRYRHLMKIRESISL